MRDDNLIDDVEEGDRDTWFNPYRVPKTERARELVVSEVLHQLQNYESIMELRQRARKPADQETFEATVTAVIADLIHFHLAGSHGALSSRGRSGSSASQADTAQQSITGRFQ